MSKKKKKKSQKQSRFAEITFHQENPPPGRLAACGKILDVIHCTIIDRDQVDCPDCLSRPDPTIVIR